jgi:hypothetical protein
MFKNTYKRGSTFTVVVSPDPCLLLHQLPQLQRTLTHSLLVFSIPKGNSQKTEQYPNAPWPAPEGDIQMECSSEQLCGPNIGPVTKKSPVRTWVSIDNVW